MSTSTSDDVTEETDEFLLLGDDEARQRVLSSSAGAAELRALSVEEIASKLEQMLLQISSQSPEPLEAPIDRTAPLMSLGLDSMTVIVRALSIRFLKNVFLTSLHLNM